jgi:hypothetical protein
VSWQDPLYPTFLALAMKLTGSDLAGPLLLQHALGLGSAWLAWAIARRMAGSLAGLLAAALAALSPVPIYYEGLVEKSAPGIFLFGLAAWPRRPPAGRAAGARGIARSRRSRGNARCFVAAQRSPRLAVRRGLSAIGIHRFSPPFRVITGASRSGQGTKLGNQRGNRTGTFQAPPFLRDDPRFEEIDWKAEAERRAGRLLEKDEVSRFWFREGLRTWLETPGFAARNTAGKALLFVSAVELPDTQAFPFFRDRFAILRLPLPGMGPTLVLAIVGVALSSGFWRARAAEIALLVGYAGSSCSSSSWAGTGSSRSRSSRPSRGWPRQGSSSSPGCGMPCVSG